MKEKVFIDTSIFVEQNYFEGDKIKQLFQFGNIDFIEIWITEIVFNEVRKNIKENLIKSNEFYRKFRKDARVLRNGKNFKMLFKNPEIDVEVEYNEIFKNFDEFIKSGNLKILSYSEIDIKETFNLYFESRSPFNDSKEKKNEFPDAFSIALIEKWCKVNHATCSLISNDKDFHHYSSKKIKIHRNFSEYIDKVNKDYLSFKEQKLLISTIDKLIEKDKDKIIEDISQKLQLDPYVMFNFNLGRFVRSIGKNELINLDILNSEFLGYSLVRVDSNYALIEVKTEFEIEVGLEIQDYSNTEYDYIEISENIIETEAFDWLVTTSFIAELSPPAGKEFAYLKLENILDIRLIH